MLPFNSTSNKEEMKPIPCVTIGEGNLLIYCLEVLQNYGYEVLGVFTNTKSVCSFCEKRNIPHFERATNMEHALKDTEFDYLFSISNPKIITEKILQLPKVMSINYHDSPLPKYAGVHATSWALINGETKHGVSWHVIEAGIDTGDVLQYMEVTVIDNDSALTLNLKCQEAAKQTFKNLITDFKSNTITRHKQPKNGRSYYGLYAIPPNAGVLSFNSTSTKINNIARALEFGNHDNALGSPKIVTSSGKFFLVTNTELTYDSVCKMDEPGSILDIIDDTIVVSTMDKPLLLSLAHLDGTLILPESYMEHDLYVGAKLSSVHIETDLLTNIRKKESFWRRQMTNYSPTMFHQQRLNMTVSLANHLSKPRKVIISLPKIKIPLEFNEITDFFIATFIAFMSRICYEKTVSVGILANKKYIPSSAMQLYSDICPVIFDISILEKMTTILAKCKESLQTVYNSHSFLIDMFYRYSDLRERKLIPHHNIVLGSLLKISEENDFVVQVLQDSNLLLLFENHEMHVFYNERTSQNVDHITGILKHFVTFLKSMKSHYNHSLSDISLVSEEDMKLLYPVMLEPVSITENPFSLFKKQFIETPNNAAVTSTKYSVTYKQLYKKVENLEAVISSLVNASQIPSKTVIVLHLPNSTAYVIAVLAAMRADQVFLPVPINYPPDRLSFIIDDSEAKMLITTTDIYTESMLSAIPSKKTNVGLVGDEDIIIIQFSQEVKTNVSKMDPDKSDSTTISDQLDNDMCYIMYTSGSTGRPKGVIGTKTGVVNLAKSQIKLWNLLENDIIAQFASIGFDATISEIFTALFAGAELVVLRESERLGQEFLTLMNKFKVTTITLPPSVLNVYKPSNLPYLRNVITAGEPCKVNIAVKWKSNDTPINFYNAYGPTETTVCATNYELKEGYEHKDNMKDLPIGTSIPGVLVYLFDENLQPVPPDVVGEIYVGGLGLSKGYIGHASRYNSEKFVQCPLSNTEMLLYKTGDHAFQDSKGLMTFVGRLDDMIKIRGQRVDLSELEHVLIQHPKIEMAIAVVHRCNKSMEPSIAAYICTSSLFVSELREYLTKLLPKYMLPTYIKNIEIKDIPITINGKIDRKSFQNDETVHVQQQNVGASEMNETQLLLSKLFCRLLKLEESLAYNFHSQTSFTELGGNSLQLVLLQRMLEEDFSIQLSFTELGTADTIEDLSNVIKRKKDILEKACHSSLEGRSELRELILKDVQSGLMLVHKKANSNRSKPPPFKTPNSIKQPRNVLISGVTGFLGAYLLSELLEQTNAYIYCMVRESSETGGLERIVKNMKRYGLWSTIYLPRVSVILSDLTHENFGISQDVYDRLCISIDVIFMNAAKMNFNTSYEDHRLANVESTKTFVQFAMTGSKKFIFYTSSLSVFLFPSRSNTSEPKPSVFYESESFDDPCLIEGGYGQSKWVSEKIVMEAINSLPGGAIFRPARISGRTETGVGPKSDLFGSMLIGMKKFGYYPDMNFPFDLTPVDYCAKAMVEIATKVCNDSCSYPTVYHLFNSKTFPFRDMFTDMDVKPLPLNTWRSRMKKIKEDHNELVPLTPFFMSQFFDRAYNWPVFDTSNTDQTIVQATKDLLLPGIQLLDIYKKFFELF